MSSRAISLGATIAVADYVAPGIFPSKKDRTKRSLRKAGMVGLEGAAASLLSSYAVSMGSPGYNSVVSTGGQYAMNVSDGIFFALVDMVVNKSSRSVKGGLSNFLIGTGASIISDSVVKPYVAPMINGGRLPSIMGTDVSTPATPLVMTATPGTSVSPGFSS